MANSQLKQIAATVIEAAGQGEADKVEPHLAEDFVLEQMVRDPATSTSAAGTCYDRATYLSLLGAVRAMTQDGMNLAVEQIIEDGNNVAVFGTSDARTPSGWVYSNAYCWHLSFRDGRLVRMREYYDTALGNRLLEG